MEDRMKHANRQLLSTWGIRVFRRATGAIDACYGFCLTGRTHLYKMFSVGWSFWGGNGFLKREGNYFFWRHWERYKLPFKRFLILLLKWTGGWQKNGLKCKTVSALCSRSRTARRNVFRQCHSVRKSTYCLWQLLLPGHLFLSLHTLTT